MRYVGGKRVLGLLRNRKDNGNPTLVAQIARHFNLPAAKAPPGGNQAFQFNQFIYLTQASHPSSSSKCIHHCTPPSASFIFVCMAKLILAME